jgi:hypothetical protein
MLLKISFAELTSKKVRGENNKPTDGGLGLKFANTPPTPEFAICLLKR